MAVDPKLWKSPFEKFPSWLCPSCQSGSLALDKDTLKVIETGPSLQNRDHMAWDVDWIVERFSALLICQDAACGQIVAIGGRTHRIFGGSDFDQGKEVWDHAFTPAFMSPAPPIFPIPNQCPDTVKEQLQRAFTLFWSDAGSCANRLRTAVEALLNDRKVPRTTINERKRKRKRETLSLHLRIEKFKRMDPDSADHLLALKWLGNAGSHANFDEPGQDVLLNGFELFEDVLERIYVKREERLKKVAKGINARKGRPARRRGRRRAPA